jgi:ADP-heptose:LPS heptosyltransferase
VNVHIDIRMVTDPEIILVFQVGSLGDTIISLPCYREIRRRHPRAQLHLLTNVAIDKNVGAADLLEPLGLIVDSLEYPMPLRDVAEMITLRTRIHKLKPAILYYLLAEVHTLNLIRHFLFFKVCGIPIIHGMPWSRPLRRPMQLTETLWESEASRLLRTLGLPPGPPSDSDRDLQLSAAEREKADHLIGRFDGGFIAISVGGKTPLNNWGDDNWCKVLSAVSHEGNLGAVFLGSTKEHLRNEILGRSWNGPRLNLCGELTPRESAAVIARALLFVGHDTGTLHLAGAVNIPIIGIYSARNRPGRWFSDRERDRFFYNHVACAGCELMTADHCPNNVACMAHDPSAVIHAVQQAVSN